MRGSAAQAEGERVVLSDALGVPSACDEDGTFVARIALLAEAEQATRGDPRSAAPPASDADGDLELPRRSAREVLRLRCVLSSPLETCGLQVWRGALLLADFALSNACCLDGTTALELGAGTGLVGLLAARRAARVLLTDVGDAVLANCAQNVAACPRASVRRLDWTQPPPWTQRALPASQTDGFAWTSDDLADLRNASVVLVADCVYDDDLTDALWSMLEALFALCPKLHAYVTVERRVNVSLSDLKARAHAFDYWRSKFHAVGTDAPSPAAPAFLVGRRINALSVPQRLSYERVPELELWDIFRADN